MKRLPIHINNAMPGAPDLFVASEYPEDFAPYMDNLEHGPTEK